MTIKCVSVKVKQFTSVNCNNNVFNGPLPRTSRVSWYQKKTFNHSLSFW